MKMANDLISRKALIAEYDRVHIGEPGKARKLMVDAPTVDAVEVVHGRWERFEEISGNIGLLCSVCGWRDYHHGRFKGNWFSYCPNCGAKMDGERKDND